MSVFRRKAKDEAKQALQPLPERSLIEELCGRDMELCEVVLTLILMNPELVVKTGPDSFVAEAQRHERAKNPAKARIAYQVAGEIALYEGNVSQAQSLLRKAAEADQSFAFRRVFDYFNIKENAERVLAIAQEFYSRTGKRTKKD